MIEIKVLGNKWKVFLLEEDAYVSQHGDADAAHTSCDSKSIYFNEGELKKEVVLHELGHAFFAETCTISASLNGEQTEEVFCELLGMHGIKMVNLSKKLYKALLDE